MEWQTILSALGGLAGIGSLISVLVFLKPTHRKINAEAANLEATAKHQQAEAAEHTLEGAFKLLEKLDGRLIDNEKKISDLECSNARFKILIDKALKRIAYLMNGIKCLLEQLEENRLKPVWQPDDWKLEED